MSSGSNHFRILKAGGSGYWMLLALLLLLVGAGYLAAHAMESRGHWITGMNNQVVWGLPHVFAILLIVAASGALNVASLSSVFGRKEYSPWARLSGLLAISLLVGGLIVLVLDLGRPERLVVAMTHYNFKSIFAWNIFLYTGFMVVVAIYLWTQFQRNLAGWVGKSGLLAFLWRFVLTSGTGGIFGFLVARQFYDAAILIPMFIVLSLVLGTAAFLLVSRLLGNWFGDGPDNELPAGLGRLMGIFIAAELFLVAAFHLTNLYATEHHGVERFILLEGGVYTALFWVGQVALGGLLPLAMIFHPAAGRVMKNVLLAALLAIFGGFCQLYVIIIGGQAYPQVLFPGKRVRSSFHDGEVASYLPSLPEWLLGIGGIALALLLVILATRVLAFLPDNRRFRRAV
jgi:molybdopterin-containing oxidoreductase family membrane subunit